MARWRELAAAGCAALELVAVLWALRGENALALLVHATACAGLALALHRHFRSGPGAWWLVFTLSLFVPVIGAWGAVAAALVTPAPDAAPGPNLIRTRIPGPMEAVARPSTWRDVRAQLAAARARNGRESVALLRGALGDEEEEVRLIAHAVLESKSRKAYRAIHEATAALEGAPAERRPALHRRLAALHFELAWLGLADGECGDYVLEQARRHALAALEWEPDRASLHFLLARIELRRRSARTAEVALRRAVQLGLPAATAQPYFAEAAFLSRRFDRVRHHLAACAPDGANRVVARVRRYWT